MVSPLYADLHGLPPLLVLAASAESLVDEARKLVDAVNESRGSVTYVERPGLVHAWPIFVPHYPPARRAVELTARFVARHAGAQP